jgi:hypothetical protein
MAWNSRRNEHHGITLPNRETHRAAMTGWVQQSAILLRELL